MGILSGWPYAEKRVSACVIFSLSECYKNCLRQPLPSHDTGVGKLWDKEVSNTVQPSNRSVRYNVPVGLQFYFLQMMWTQQAMKHFSVYVCRRKILVCPPCIKTSRAWEWKCFYAERSLTVWGRWAKYTGGPEEKNIWAALLGMMPLQLGLV